VYDRGLPNLKQIQSVTGLYAVHQSNGEKNNLRPLLHSRGSHGLQSAQRNGVVAAHGRMKISLVHNRNSQRNHVQLVSSWSSHGSPKRRSSSDG
jgi:hypothetical protein